ncbi:MAG: hypothetical protein R2822_14485 [Spirosomataceae bacterium]
MTNLFCCCLILQGAAHAQSNNGFAVQTTIEHGVIEGNYDTKTGIQTFLEFLCRFLWGAMLKAPQPLAPLEGE